MEEQKKDTAIEIHIEVTKEAIVKSIWIAAGACLTWELLKYWGIF